MFFRKQIRCACRQSFGVIRDVDVQKDIYIRACSSSLLPYQRKLILFTFLLSVFRRLIAQVISEFFRMNIQPIPNVDMDQCACSDQWLGTTGVGPCVCFVVILNKGKDVFMEHRSGVGLPSVFTPLHATQYLKRVANQIHTMRPGSSVT